MDPRTLWDRLCSALSAGKALEAAHAAEDLDCVRMLRTPRPEAIPSEVWRMGALRDFARLCRAVRRTQDQACAEWTVEEILAREG